MATLVLRLAGPMQAWGDTSRFSRRMTASEPTKSGVLGLLAAAGGRRRTDPIEDLARLAFGVRVDQRGTLQRDFRTARSLDGSRVMPLTDLYYLSDAAFVAAVEGESGLIAGLAAAVQSPVFPLFLGRRSYVPARPLFIGVSEAPLEQTLRTTTWEAADWYRRRQGKSVHLELALDAGPDDDAGDVEAHRDVPVSFDSTRREYGWRDVVRPEPVVVENAQGRDGPDFMAALEGA